MESLKNLIKSYDKFKFLIFAGLAGILLISFPYNRKEEVRDDPAAYSRKYVIETEKRLTSILEKIEGVGDVSVMLTLDSSEEVVYAKNEKTSSDLSSNPGDRTDGKKEITRKESTYVFSDYGSDRSALKIMSTEPKVKGVIVVCEGGGNPIVRTRVTEASATVLGIKYADVFVAKLNQ